MCRPSRGPWRRCNLFAWLIARIGSQGWNCEDIFDDDRAGENAGDSGTEKRDDGEHSAFQCVAKNDGAGHKAFGIGGADVILVENVEHAGADEAGDFSSERRAETERGEDELHRCAPAGSREYRPDEHEQNDQQTGDDEIRDCDANGGEGHEGEIEQAAAADRGDDAGGEPEREGEGKSEDAERGRDRETGGDDFVDAENRPYRN